MDLEELKKEQERLAKSIVIGDDFSGIRLVAGCDQAFLGDNVISAVVVLDYENLEPVERAYSVTKEDFPYIPGFLSFREGPAIVKAYKKLRNAPDILLIDGQGICHPRSMGLASHAGLLLKVPSIGVAKSRLCGEYREPVKGIEALSLKGKQVGWVLKTREGCRPLFVSPGHMVSLESSLEIVINTLKKHKLPEPLRLAHLYANEVKHEISEA